MNSGLAALVRLSLPDKAVKFGKRLTELRVLANLSIYALAKKSGVSHQAITRLEKGRGDPNWTTATELAKALGVSVSAFEAESVPELTDEPSV